jgi:hypothetical protein
MIATSLLILLLIILLAGLGGAAWYLRRRQQVLQHRREALRKQRGAAHIREIALSAQAHTGRADIAVMLLQLSIELLEEALRLAPDEQAVGESLAQLHQLIDSMQLDDRPPTPIPNPESLAELTRASMQITEAIRLLVRLEARGEMDRDELRAMQAELRHVQHTIDARTRTRQELQAPSALLAAVDTSSPRESSGNARIGPLN